MYGTFVEALIPFAVDGQCEGSFLPIGQFVNRAQEGAKDCGGGDQLGLQLGRLCHQLLEQRQSRLKGLYFKPDGLKQS